MSHTLDFVGQRGSPSGVVNHATDDPRTNARQDASPGARVHTEQYHCDVLVVGSGAGGFSAAITATIHGLKVLMVEKEHLYGGSSAYSGGRIWIPTNSLARNADVKDSIERAHEYLRAEAKNFYDYNRVQAFLYHGPRMIDFMGQRTRWVRFATDPQYAGDYHPELPGAQVGRSLLALPFNGRKLGAHRRNLRPPIRDLTVAGLVVGNGFDMKHFLSFTRSFKSAGIVIYRMAIQLLDLALHGRGMRLAMGNALVGRLFRSAADLNIPLWLSSPVRELKTNNLGEVTGAIVSRNGQRVHVHASRGVVLACGGYAHDIARRQQCFNRPLNAFQFPTIAPPGNTGDGLRLAESAGAEIETKYPNDAYRIPVSSLVRPNGTRGIFPLWHGAARPGFIAVNTAGKRFTNESHSYHDLAEAILNLDDRTAFAICDHKAIRLSGLGYAKPTPLPLKRHIRSGYLTVANTIEELAEKLGIDQAALRATVDEHNRHAARGEDPLFNKGGNVYNQFRGDALNKPNPCLRPLDQPPFYAVKATAGDAGTLGGIKTDEHAQALDAAGKPIPGLYAVGTDMASIFGGSVPVAGTNLGPALTFGYIAGRHLAGVPGDAGP